MCENCYYLVCNISWVFNYFSVAFIGVKNAYYLYRWTITSHARARSLKLSTFLKRREGRAGETEERIGTRKQEEWKRKKGDGESAEGCGRGWRRERRLFRARMCHARGWRAGGGGNGWEGGARERLSPRTWEFKLGYAHISRHLGRFTDTFIRFKEMLARVDSSALTESSLAPARRIYGGWSHGLWSIERISPLRTFSPMLARLVLSLSLYFLFSLRAPKKTRCLFSSFSCCLPFSPFVLYTNWSLLKSNVFRVAWKRFAFPPFFFSQDVPLA